jgi:hypothetical protein
MLQEARPTTRLGLDYPGNPGSLAARSTPTRKEKHTKNRMGEAGMLD